MARDRGAVAGLLPVLPFDTDRLIGYAAIGAYYVDRRMGAAPASAYR
jgi:hypothetical protein